MQYRYGAKSLAWHQFDAAKAKLLHSCALNSDQTSHPRNTRHYAARCRGFAGKIRFFAAGQPLETAGIPLGSATTKLPPASPGAETAEVPATAAIKQSAPGGENAPPGDNHHPQIPEESGLRPASEHFSTALLGGVLSVTVAMAAGLIIARTTAFKVAVSPDLPLTTEVVSHAPATAVPGDAAAPRPARAIQAPPAPALSIAKDESLLVLEKPRQSSRPRALQRTALPKNKAFNAKLARRVEKAKIARVTRRTTPAPIARAPQKLPDPVVQASSASAVQLRPASPSLGARYAQCTQQQGFLRREKCKWEVCGGKWGKQGCPSYKHKLAPEMGLGQLYSADTSSHQEDS